MRGRSRAVLMAVALAVPGCSTGASDVCGVRPDRLVIGGQAALVLRPEAPSGAAVVYHHGVGEDETAVVDDPQKRPLVCALLAAGYVVAGSNAHGENWGNDAALADYRALSSRLAADDLMIWSQSMGGLSGLLSATDEGTPNVRAWAGIYPLTNLGFAAEQPGSDFPERIDLAYGPADRDGHDPQLVGPERFTVPMLAWASYDDTIVPRRDNIDALAARVPIEIISTAGEHGDNSNFDADRLVRFFDAARYGTEAPANEPNE